MFRVAFFMLFLIFGRCNTENADVNQRNIAQNVEIIKEDKINYVIKDTVPNLNSDKTIKTQNPETLNITEFNNQTNSSNSISNIKDKNITANATAEVKNKFKVKCAQKFYLENEVPTVQLTNSSTLLKMLNPHKAQNVTVAECVVVLFYSSQCIFSARMAPHYNALPRVFPDVAFYAIDIVKHNNLYIRFGLVYVPNVMLFHNSKAIARFNETNLNLETLVKFINKHTGLQHNDTLNVTSADMNGPVPSSLDKQVDYWLVLAWVFTLSCLCFGFAKSSVCQHMVEFLKNTWQEAEAQHEHED